MGVAVRPGDVLTLAPFGALTGLAASGPDLSIFLSHSARVTDTAPIGEPADQTSGFSYTPPAGTTSVTLRIQRVVQNGGATVSPIRFYDGCGLWPTFVGGGPNAFR